MRERRMNALNSGLGCRAVSDRFGVSISAVLTWSQRFRATGRVSARQTGRHRPFALATVRDAILIPGQSRGGEMLTSRVH